MAKKEPLTLTERVTIKEDFETLEDVITGLLEEFTLVESYSAYDYSRGRYTTRYRQKKPHSQSDPLMIALWALNRIKKQLARGANAEIKQMVDAVLADAHADAKEIKEKARREAKAECEQIVAATKRAHANILDAIERGVEKRIEEMYGRGAMLKRRRKLGMADGKKLVLVDDEA